MFCPECGTQNPDGSKFCSSCATQLPLVTPGNAPGIGPGGASGEGPLGTKVMPPAPWPQSMPPSPYANPQYPPPTNMPYPGAGNAPYPGASNAPYPGASTEPPGYGGYPPGMQPAGAPAYPPYQQPLSADASKPGGKAIAAAALGIASIVFCFPVFSTGFAIAGIVLGRMELEAIKQGKAGRGGDIPAKIGFYTGIVGVVLSLLVTLAYCASFLIR